MEIRIINENECKSVYTLNTWTDDKMNEVRELLEHGFYVHLGSSALGHTMSEIVENDGINRVLNEYGDRVEVVMREGWRDIYCHLTAIRGEGKNPCGSGTNSQTSCRAGIIF